MLTSIIRMSNLERRGEWPDFYNPIPLAFSLSGSALIITFTEWPLAGISLHHFVNVNSRDCCEWKIPGNQ